MNLDFSHDWTSDEKAARHIEFASQLDHIFDVARKNLSPQDSFFNALHDFKEVAEEDSKFPRDEEFKIKSTFRLVPSKKSIAKVDNNYFPIWEDFKAMTSSIYALLWIKPKNERMDPTDYVSFSFELMLELPLLFLVHLIRSCSC